MYVADSPWMPDNFSPLTLTKLEKCADWEWFLVFDRWFERQNWVSLVRKKANKKIVLASVWSILPLKTPEFTPWRVSWSERERDGKKGIHCNTERFGARRSRFAQNVRWNFYGADQIRNTKRKAITESKIPYCLPWEELHLFWQNVCEIQFTQVFLFTTVWREAWFEKGQSSDSRVTGATGEIKDCFDMSQHCCLFISRECCVFLMQWDVPGMSATNLQIRYQKL